MQTNKEPVSLGLLDCPWSEPQIHHPHHNIHRRHVHRFHRALEKSHAISPDIRRTIHKIVAVHFPL